MEIFEHFNAFSIDEAISLLSRYGEDASIIAGGTDLIVGMKQKVKDPKYVINIKTIPSLAYIREDDELRIGALTTLHGIENSPIIKGKYACLQEAAHSVASIHIRNLGTIGGNLCQQEQCWYSRNPQFACHRTGGDQCFAFEGESEFSAIFPILGEKCWASFPSDIAPALIALNAKVKIAGPTGERVVPVEDLYCELGNTLQVAEILTEIQIPVPKPNTKSTYLKFRLSRGCGFAVASSAVAVTKEKGICREARIALGGIAPIPWRGKKAEEVLKGKEIDDKAAEDAANAVMADAKPLKKNAYKEPITKAVLKRAILAC